MVIKAVIFDIGGVCVGSPMAGIHCYEKQYNLPRNYINVAIVSQGDNGAFQKFERGEIKIHDFYRDFGTQLSDVKNKEYYKQYLLKTGKNVPIEIPDVKVDGKELFRIMMAETERVDVHIFKAIQQLKKSGKFKVAALTNNFEMPESDPNEVKALGGGTPDDLKKSFDYFIESRLVGLRKPDPKFYLYACDLLKIQPNEAVFLDDIGINLRAAKDLGINTIQVKMGKSKDAVKELGNMVNMDLLGSSNL
ncbi:unnamed protein product [Cunninghamella blakesleeana]